MPKHEIHMTAQEAIDKLVKQSADDVQHLREILEEYRRDQGIPVSQFIELIATVAQDYRLLQQYYKR